MNFSLWNRTKLRANATHTLTWTIALCVCLFLSYVEENIGHQVIHSGLPLGHAALGLSTISSPLRCIYEICIIEYTFLFELSFALCHLSEKSRWILQHPTRSELIHASGCPCFGTPSHKSFISQPLTTMLHSHLTPTCQFDGNFHSEQTTLNVRNPPTHKKKSISVDQCNGFCTTELSIVSNLCWR